jgi:hypothetical protein
MIRVFFSFFFSKLFEPSHYNWRMLPYVPRYETIKLSITTFLNHPWIFMPHSLVFGPLIFLVSCFYLCMYTYTTYAHNHNIPFLFYSVDIFVHKFLWFNFKRNMLLPRKDIRPWWNRVWYKHSHARMHWMWVHPWIHEMQQTRPRKNLSTPFMSTFRTNCCSW